MTYIADRLVDAETLCNVAGDLIDIGTCVLVTECGRAFTIELQLPPANVGFQWVDIQ